MRAIGYYRVKYKGLWYIMLYDKLMRSDERKWHFRGQQLSDKCFDEINETPINPTPTTIELPTNEEINKKSYLYDKLAGIKNDRIAHNRGAIWMRDLIKERIKK